METKPASSEFGSKKCERSGHCCSACQHQDAHPNEAAFRADHLSVPRVADPTATAAVGGADSRRDSETPSDSRQ